LLFGHLNKNQAMPRVTDVNDRKVQEWLRLTAALFELGIQLRPIVTQILTQRFLPAVLAEAKKYDVYFPAVDAGLVVYIVNKNPSLPLAPARSEWHASEEAKALWWEVQTRNGGTSFFVHKDDLKPNWSEQEQKQLIREAIKAARDDVFSTSHTDSKLSEKINSAQKERTKQVLQYLERNHGFQLQQSQQPGLPTPRDTLYNKQDLVCRLWAEIVLSRHASSGSKGLNSLSTAWKNCDMSLWGSSDASRGVWEMAKVFLPQLSPNRDYCLSKVSAEDLSTDLLLKLLQQMQGDAFGELDKKSKKCLVRASGVRNTRYGHAAHPCLEKEDAKQYINELIAVLEQLTHLTQWIPATMLEQSIAKLKAVQTQDMSLEELQNLRDAAEYEKQLLQAEHPAAENKNQLLQAELDSIKTLRDTYEQRWRQQRTLITDLNQLESVPSASTSLSESTEGHRLRNKAGENKKERNQLRAQLREKDAQLLEQMGFRRLDQLYLKHEGKQMSRKNRDKFANLQRKYPSWKPPSLSSTGASDTESAAKAPDRSASSKSNHKYRELQAKLKAVHDRKQLERKIRQLEGNPNRTKLQSVELSARKQQLEELNKEFPESEVSDLPPWTGLPEQPVVPESTQAQANIALPDRSTLRDREDVPLLYPGDTLSGYLSYYVVEKVDHGGQGHIYKAYYEAIEVEGKKKCYNVAIKQQRRRRSDIASEAEVYFKLNPAESTHVSLLFDAVNHPLRSEIPLLITEWAEQGSLKAWLQTKRGCAVFDCSLLADKNFFCNDCQVVHYCTHDHQVQHWNSHKRECKSAQVHGMQVGLAILIQVANGLTSLHTHEAKIVHQDLKPANVLLYEYSPDFELAVPVVKVADFGLCRTQEDDMGTDSKGLLTGRAGGTREYMAPDQARQYAQQLERKIAPGSENASSKLFWDLWAFGLLVVEVTAILTGRRGLLQQMEGYCERTGSDLSNAFGEVRGGLKTANASVAKAVASMKERASQIVQAMSVDTKHPLASTWNALVTIVTHCFRSRLMSSDCVRMLTDAYNQLDPDSCFPSVIRLSSPQYQRAVRMYQAYSPREHQATFEARVLNEYLSARDLLRRQVCEDLKQESSTPIERLLVIAQNLLEEKTSTRWLPSLLDMVCAYGGQWPMQTSESEPAGLGKVVIQLHMLWLRSTDKELCSRRLGTGKDVFGPLYILCSRGASGAIQQALSIAQAQGRASALVNCTYPHLGETSLHFASFHGHGSVVSQLLELKANVNHARSDGCTSLLCASRNGHDSVVGQLLESKASVDRASIDGVTSLHVASQNGHDSVVGQLLESNANVNHAATDGTTSLCIASQNGHDSIVGQLLESKANVDHASPDISDKPLCSTFRPACL
jgi:serine/threonine protein kinase/aryl carrier-like protein